MYEDIRERQAHTTLGSTTTCYLQILRLSTNTNDNERKKTINDHRENERARWRVRRKKKGCEEVKTNIHKHEKKEIRHVYSKQRTETHITTTTLVTRLNKRVR